MQSLVRWKQRQHIQRQHQLEQPVHLKKPLLEVTVSCISDADDSITTVNCLLKQGRSPCYLDTR
jgi:hypothetical protein